MTANSIIAEIPLIKNIISELEKVKPQVVLYLDDSTYRIEEEYGAQINDIQIKYNINNQFVNSKIIFKMNLQEGTFVFKQTAFLNYITESIDSTLSRIPNVFFKRRGPKKDDFRILIHDKVREKTYDVEFLSKIFKITNAIYEYDRGYGEIDKKTENLMRALLIVLNVEAPK